MPEELSRAASGWRLRMPDVVPGLQVDGARVPVEDLVHETRALLHQHLLGLGAVHDGLEDAADYRVLEYWRIRLNKHCHCTALRRLFRYSVSLVIGLIVAIILGKPQYE